jgi:hypothetical protein
LQKAITPVVEDRDETSALELPNLQKARKCEAKVVNRRTYIERRMPRLMQEDEGTKMDWDKKHKKALYWVPEESLHSPQQK